MRLKTLNGAPLCEHLDFRADTLFKPEQGHTTFEDFSNSLEVEQSSATVKWRRLAARETRLRSGWSQPYLPTGGVNSEDAQFSSALPGAETSFASFTEDTTGGNEFLQHSLIFYDTLVSSQIKLGPGADNTVSSSSFLNDSFNATLRDLQDHETAIMPGLTLHVPSNLEAMPLADVPTSKQLQAIHPQTLTPSFLCVLTSKAGPREVLVRKGGYRMSLHEISIADETRAGFQVTFWFRPTSRGGSVRQSVQEDLRTTVEQARAGDILLLRNIALSSFRDQVHGQSLNASITRAKTTAQILLRGDGPSSLQLNSLPQALEEKLSRVRKWANAHIVHDYVGSRKRKRNLGSKDHSYGPASKVSDPNEDSLPPDTMEG